MDGLVRVPGTGCALSVAGHLEPSQPRQVLSSHPLAHVEIKGPELAGPPSFLCFEKEGDHRGLLSWLLSPGASPQTRLERWSLR